MVRKITNTIFNFFLTRLTLLQAPVIFPEFEQTLSFKSQILPELLNQIY